MPADEYTSWQTAYLFRSPKNARRLLDAYERTLALEPDLIAAALEGAGVQRSPDVATPGNKTLESCGFFSPVPSRSGPLSPIWTLSDVSSVRTEGRWGPPAAQCPPGLDLRHVTSPDVSRGHARRSPYPAACRHPVASLVRAVASRR